MPGCGNNSGHGFGKSKTVHLQSAVSTTSARNQRYFAMKKIRTLKFRPMLPTDVEATLAVRLSTRENAVTLRELKEDYGVTPISMANALTSDAKGWLCEADGKVVGFSVGNGQSGEVAVVAVSPEFEGFGIGKTVLAHVQGWLFSLGYEEIWLLANPDPGIRATGFYEKLGWQATGIMKGSDQILRLRRDR